MGTILAIIAMACLIFGRWGWAFILGIAAVVTFIRASAGSKKVRYRKYTKTDFDPPLAMMSHNKQRHLRDLKELRARELITHEEFEEHYADAMAEEW